MGTNVMIPAGFAQGKLAAVFQGAKGEELGAGIRSGFGIIGYRGKVWSTKYQGEEKPLMREDGDGARASIEVVIVKASGSIAKIYYETGFVDGSTAPPDCWSTNGVTPDGGSPKKQSPTCAGCPKNAWGSKVTEAGKQTKACSDSKRLAVVPAADMKNEAMGGTMLLRVPAATLKDLKSYGDTLMQYGYPYYGVVTRISFDINEAFPKFVLSAVRPLTDAEAETILELQKSTQTNSILNESVEIAQHEPAAVVPATPFEQPPAQVQARPTQPAPVQPATAPVAQPAPAAAEPAAAPEKRKRRTKEEMAAAAAALAAQRSGGAPAQPTQPAPQVAQQPAGGEAPAPANFDALLDNLLPA